MTQYRASQPNTTGTSSHGNAFNVDAKVTVAAALTTADEVILGELPAGFRLSGFKYRAGDLDTGTGTLVGNLGFRSRHPDQTVAAQASYFLNASGAFAAAQASWVDLAFEPITFQEPVQIVFKPTTGANAQAAAAAIWSIFSGSIVGVQ